MLGYCASVYEAKTILKRTIKMGLIKYCFFSLILVLLLSFCNATAWAVKGNDNARMVIHLLDYIGKDYVAAVVDGKIINDEEYGEMLEFSVTIHNMAQPVLAQYPQQRSVILSQIRQLGTLVRQKADQKKVAELARNIKSQVIDITSFEASPRQWPDVDRGNILYEQYCTTCHGITGNGKGKLAKALNPSPTDFLNDSLMKQVSPLQSFNTIGLGIEGTAMRGFKELSEEEAWDLAFYIHSLRFKTEADKSFKSKEIAPDIHDEVGLLEVSTMSDQELLNRLDADKEEAAKKLAAIRLHVAGKNSGSFLHLAKQNLGESLIAYRKGLTELARQKALAAYLDGVEPVEAHLKANDPAFTSDFEQQMMQLRAAIENNKPVNVVEEEVNALLAMVSKAASMLEDTKLTFWLSFLLSTSILLREGVEAFLIIAVMMTIIQSVKIKEALLWLHGGWIMAVLLGFAGWYAADLLLEFSGRDREIIEGVVAILAVGILTFVGFWLHSNSHAKKWKDFIENRVKKLLKTENMLGLGIFSFMAVFREALESVLFLHAIKLETSPENQSSIGLGALAAFIIMSVLIILFVRYSKKIPVRHLFRYSAWVVTLLAVILLGKGIHSIQESGLFSVTVSPIHFRVEWLGLYPTLETVLGQAILLGLIFSLWYISTRKAKQVDY